MQKPMCTTHACWQNEKFPVYGNIYHSGFINSYGEPLPQKYQQSLIPFDQQSKSLKYDELISAITTMKLGQN